MLIALLGARVEARGRQLDLDQRGVGSRFIDRERAADVREAALYGGDHHVLRRELDERVGRVDRPRGRRRSLGCNGSHRHWEGPLGYVIRSTVLRDKAKMSVMVPR